MCFQQVAMTEILLQDAVWFPWKNDCWKEGYFVKWPYTVTGRKKETQVIQLHALKNFALVILVMLNRSWAAILDKPFEIG